MSQYVLYVGTSPGTYNIYGSAESGTSRTVSNLPTNGSTIHVRIWSFINGNWQTHDAQYRAAWR